MKAKSLLQNDNREQLCVFNTMTEVKKRNQKTIKSVVDFNLFSYS